MNRRDAIGALLAIGIPFTLLLLNGLKILFRINLNLKRTGAVMAGVINKMILPAVVAAINFPAQGARAALENALHGPLVRRKDLRRKLSLILRPMPAQHFRQRNHGSALKLSRVDRGPSRRPGCALD